MKKLLVASALTLLATGAYASNFRGADQVYVPVAAHQSGNSGVFITDAYISNLSADPVSVSVIYQPVGAELPADQSIGTEFRDVIKLKAYERKEYLDFYKSALNFTTGQNAFGQLIFNGCKDNTDCGPATQNNEGVSPNFRPISVETRIYSIPKNAPPNAPTTGQLFSGIPWYNYVSELQNNVGLDKVFITGITQNGTAGTPGTYRSNVGLVNVSQWSTTTMDVKIYQGTMTDADKKGEILVTLKPLGSILKAVSGQADSLFPNLAPGSNYFITVEQRNSEAFGNNVPASCDKGCPAFLAYGSVLDNVSGDATTLEPQYLKELDAEAILVIYPKAGSSDKSSNRRAVRH